jgi:peptide chain release factor 1
LSLISQSTRQISFLFLYYFSKLILRRSLYLCDNKFHTEALSELLESDARFGFIVMDGNGTLFGTLAGNTREIIHKFTVDLPKKHGRGGQSALRFSRLRDEKRHNYVRKVAELAVQHFITNDKVNVAGLVLAGSADFKTELSQSDMFDPRLVAKIIKVVDVSYGGENGFNQAIELAAESLSNVKFVQEKKLIQKYFDEISMDSGKYCFGIDDTLKALELGAVETLIVWENLDIQRHVLRNAAGGRYQFCLPEGYPLIIVQRKSLSTSILRSEKTRRSSWISLPAWRWSRSKNTSRYSSGSRKSIVTSVPTSSLSPIVPRRARSS